MFQPLNANLSFDFHRMAWHFHKKGCGFIFLAQWRFIEEPGKEARTPSAK